jgi:hypothetical protein
MPTPEFNFQVEDYNCTGDYPVLISTSENSVEQRRLITDKELWQYDLVMPNYTEAQKSAFVTFYRNKKGSLTAFTFRCPMRGTIINVRFDGELRMNYSRGIYKIRCSLVQVANSEIV